MAGMALPQRSSSGVPVDPIPPGSLSSHPGLNNSLPIVGSEHVHRRGRVPSSLALLLLGVAGCFPTSGHSEDLRVTSPAGLCHMRPVAASRSAPPCATSSSSDNPGLQAPPLPPFRLAGIAAAGAVDFGEWDSSAPVGEPLVPAYDLHMLRICNPPIFSGQAHKSRWDIKHRYLIRCGGNLEHQGLPPSIWISTKQSKKRVSLSLYLFSVSVLVRLSVLSTSFRPSACQTASTRGKYVLSMMMYM